MKKPGTFAVRLATPADISQMQRIRRRVRENQLSDPSRVTDGDCRRMILERGRGWVCELDGLIVGFAIGDLVVANIWALFVDPEHEKRGIGRALHRPMLDWMFASGADKVWLGTEPGTRAEDFYRKAGWQLAGEQPNGEQRFEMTARQWAAISAKAGA